MRAGQALRDKWAAETRAAERARNPRLAAQDAAEHAAMKARSQTLATYGRLLRSAVQDGTLTVEQSLDLFLTAEERTYQRLNARRERIFGGDR